MNKLVEKLITNIIYTTFFIFILYIQELNWVQNIFDVHPTESYISYQVSSVPVIAHTSFLPPSIVEWF
jgi:hypothetical protein